MTEKGLIYIDDGYDLERSVSFEKNNNLTALNKPKRYIML